jgi:hypothetical protein
VWTSWSGFSRLGITALKLPERCHHVCELTAAGAQSTVFAARFNRHIRFAARCSECRKHSK